MTYLDTCSRCDYTAAAHGDVECRRIAERYGVQIPCHRFEPLAPRWLRLLADVLGRWRR